MELGILFTDGMVLQANHPIVVSGKGSGKVSVSFLGKTYEAVSEGENWELSLPAENYGGPYEMEVNLNGEAKVLRDIMVGEVILLSGQSNLQWEMHHDKSTGVRYETNDMIRTFVGPRIEYYDGIKYYDGWQKANGDTIPHWSAVGYFVAAEINRRRGIAVGIIGAYQGASIIQSWLPKEEADRFEFFVPGSEVTHSYFYPLYSAWNRNGKNYDFVIRKLMPYSVGRLVWYQGCSNATMAEGAIYDKMLLRLIDIYRRDFRNDKMPVTVVQIADHDVYKKNPGGYAIQDAQARAVEAGENMKLVISKDISVTNDIHPPEKKPLSMRIVDSMGF